MKYTESSLIYCLGIKEDAPIIKQEDWISLGKKTIEDLDNNNTLIKKWNESVRKGIIEPTARNFRKAM